MAYLEDKGKRIKYASIDNARKEAIKRIWNGTKYEIPIFRNKNDRYPVGEVVMEGNPVLPKWIYVSYASGYEVFYDLNRDGTLGRRH